MSLSIVPTRANGAVAGAEQQQVANVIGEHIFIQSSDGNVKLSVSKEVLTLVPFINKELMSTGRGTSDHYPVVLPRQVTTDTLELIHKYISFHAARDRSDKERKLFDEKFVKMDTKKLCELTSAADSLEMRPLVDMASRALARLIEGKSPEEIREAFNLPDDLSEEEKLEPVKNLIDDPRIRLLNRLFAKKRKELQTRKAEDRKAAEERAKMEDTRSVDELLMFIEDGPSSSASASKASAANTAAVAGKKGGEQPAAKSKKAKQKEKAKAREAKAKQADRERERQAEAEQSSDSREEQEPTTSGRGNDPEEDELQAAIISQLTQSMVISPPQPSPPPSQQQQQQRGGSSGKAQQAAQAGSSSSSQGSHGRAGIGPATPGQKQGKGPGASAHQTQQQVKGPGGRQPPPPPPPPPHPRSNGQLQVPLSPPVGSVSAQAPHWRLSPGSLGAPGSVTSPYSARAGGSTGSLSSATSTGSLNMRASGSGLHGGPAGAAARAVPAAAAAAPLVPLDAPLEALFPEDGFDDTDVQPGEPTEAELYLAATGKPWDQRVEELLRAPVVPGGGRPKPRLPALPALEGDDEEGGEDEDGLPPAAVDPKALVEALIN